METNEKPVVLMVDDDPDVLAYGEYRFEVLHNYEFRKAQSYNEAVEIIKSTHRDMVVLTDINFPDPNLQEPSEERKREAPPLGLKLMLWCQKHVPHRVVVFGLTADHRDSILLNSLRADAITVFYKDHYASFDELMEKLVAHAGVSGISLARRREWQDSSTRFWNFAGFRLQVEPMLEAAFPHENVEERRDEKHFAQFALLFIEVENWKKIVEVPDSKAGVKAASEVAALIREHVRPTDHLCRRGDDEFLVFLPDADRSRGEEIAAALRRGAVRLGSTVGGSKAQILLRVGIDHIDRSDLTGNAEKDLDFLIFNARDSRS